MMFLDGRVTAIPSTRQLATAFDRALDLHFHIAGYFAVCSPEAAATAIARQRLLVAGPRVPRQGSPIYGP